MTPSASPPLLTAKTAGARPRWFTATALPFDPTHDRFWFADLGALCLEFRRLGIDSQFVVWGRPEQMLKDKPLILCSPEEMASAAWWKQWQVDGVVLNSWAAPRHTPVARAIKEAGAQLIVRMDTDGLKSPRLNFLQFLSNTYFAARDAGHRLPAIHALAKTLLFRLAPSVHDLKMCEHLELADIVTVESALARQYLERLLEALGRAELAAKFRVVPQYACLSQRDEPATPRQPVILAVGRWDAWQKDGPKLMRVLGRTLERRMDYSARVIGGGREFLQAHWRRLPETARQRIHLAGPLPHEQLEKHYLESRILLFTSRYEGFPFAASEALCCGCTVVGSVSLPSMCHITTCGGGTVAIGRLDEDFVDALGVEMTAWDEGWRDPEQVSRWWKERVSLRAIARELLSLGNVNGVD